MTVRKGASLINIMVFVMFAMMVTAQVFFYTATSFEGLTDEREIMSYRLMLDSIVRLASSRLAENGSISHKTDSEGNKIQADYSNFYTEVQVWNLADDSDAHYTNEYHATIHDLDYALDTTTTPFSRTTWENNKYNEKYMYKKIFAAMNPPVMANDITTDADGNITVNYRYYLLRAYVDLPEKKFYGRKLMYQVLFRRSEDSTTDISPTKHRLYLESFQEIWF